MTLSPGRPDCLKGVQGGRLPSSFPFPCSCLSEFPFLQPEDPRTHRMLPASSFPGLAGEQLLPRWQAKCVSPGEEPLTRD